VGYENGGYGKIGECGKNGGQVDVWCSLKECTSASVTVTAEFN